ncbi:hypothetical protein POVWA2_095830 [Plasmodium ovale wallikeri]|uniref:PIR Superfamily Protein n=1 Tax=Plasmodium ovale wallikeri TaxID=864142 RepID=A0A1A9AT03_PLAOA|nr:hypothetical protein POVWA2_095830 [Plasmodium ovale wallikeri]
MKSIFHLIRYPLVCFATFGNLLNVTILNKQNIGHYVEKEEADYFAEQTGEPSNKSTEKDTHLLSYHAVKNTLN